MTLLLADVDTYEVPGWCLTETWALLREPGRQGFEAAALWIGRQRTREIAAVSRVVRPRQHAVRSDYGVGVALDPDALTDLILNLEDDVVLVRLHTHPTAAYHSHVDDQNSVIGHVGALSVVVPDFAAGPIDLKACSVHELGPSGWTELPPERIHERFVLT